jgi:integrase
MGQVRDPDARGWHVFPRVENGRKTFVCQYKDAAGEWRTHRVPRDIQSQRDAERYSAVWVPETLARGVAPATPIELPPDRGPTVAEIADRWLKLRRAETKRGDVAPKTVANNEQHLKTHILPTLGSLPVKALAEGPARLRQFVAELREKPRTRTGKDKKRVTIEGSTLSNNHVRNVCMTLSKMLSDAQAEQWAELAANPMAHEAVKLPRAETLAKGEIVFVERAAVEALLRDPRIDSERRAFYLLSFLTGLDVAEIAGLSWEHVDLDGTVPTVRVTRCFKASGEHGPTKRRSRVRTVPLHPLAVTMLRARKNAHWVELVATTRSRVTRFPVWASRKSDRHAGSQEGRRPALLARRGRCPARRPAARRLLRRAGRARHYDEKLSPVVRHLAPRGQGRRERRRTLDGAFRQERHRQALHGG